MIKNVSNVKAYVMAFLHTSVGTILAIILIGYIVHSITSTFILTGSESKEIFLYISEMNFILKIIYFGIVGALSGVACFLIHLGFSEFLYDFKKELKKQKLNNGDDDE